MARRDQFQMSLEERHLRTFSTGFKTAIVREIEQGKTKKDPAFSTESF